MRELEVSTECECEMSADAYWAVLSDPAFGAHVAAVDPLGGRRGTHVCSGWDHDLMMGVVARRCVVLCAPMHTDIRAGTVRGVCVRARCVCPRAVCGGNNRQWTQ